ncbi:MAG: hypothetical protein EU535_02920 [Promethearchaeota archaeon]|nr:MAG: hypothetical protein EU535_02920 [Candidatus Lokiarchaeota archaeon]
MELQEIIGLILEEIKKKNYINISEFLTAKNIKNLKTKDLISEIQTNQNEELIVNLKNTEIFSYDLVYNYCKLKLFDSLDKNYDIDLDSDDFKEFYPFDLIRTFCRIDSEFFNYLIEPLNSRNTH